MDQHRHSGNPHRDPLPSSGKAERADYESTPITRQEYISAMVHLYRGELYRATQWRMRLDTTTNWAVITTAGLLSFAFGEGVHSHWILLMGVTLVMTFWGFESRRFRYSDLWYVRLRLIEENFYGPILRRDPRSPDFGWGELVAEDLFHPRFKISRLQALRERFVRNYWAIFGVLLFAWTVKLTVAPEPAHSWGEIQQRLAMGFLPWWIPFVFVGLIMFFFVGLVVLVPGISQDDQHEFATPPPAED